MWFDETTFEEFANRSGFRVVDDEPLLWDRTPESPFDGVYLAVKSVLQSVERFQKPFARSHCYVLEQS